MKTINVDVSKITDDSKEDDKHTTINGNNNFENKIIIDVNYLMSRYRFIFPESVTPEAPVPSGVQ